MDAWIDLAWFVVWAVVIVAALGIIVWAVIARLAIKRFREAEKEFNKGFDSDFFKSARSNLRR